MSFEDWYRWARAQPDHCWKTAAEHSRAKACYQSPATGAKFRAALGKKSPNKRPDFEVLCREFALTGRNVGGVPPRFLFRVVKEENLQTMVGFATASGGSSRDLVAQVRQNSSVSWRPPLENRFTNLTDLAPLANSTGHLARADRRSVFAALSPGDDETPDKTVPRFWAKIRKEKRFGMRVADIARHRLALGPIRTETMQVLLYYDREGLDPFLIPVPPDAGLHPLFHPRLCEGNSQPPAFGRTCPGGPGNCDEDAAEDELVHSNQPIRYNRVWVISLGKTTVSGK